MYYFDSTTYLNMNTTSNVIEGKESVYQMLEGIKVATKLIRTTYGPNGKNISVENSFYPYHQVANDAQTIIQATFVKGQAQVRGLNFLKEAMDKVNLISGDGRKTTCIMIEEILERGLDADIPNIKRELDNLIPILEKEIDSHKEEINEDNIHTIATTAGESAELGAVIGESYKKIGKDGIIIPESSGTPNTYFNVIEGIRFNDTGYLSYAMVHDEQAKKDGRPETKAIYHNPKILVTKRKISNINEIDPLLTSMMQSGEKDLVIFTDDMDSGVATALVNTHKAGIMNILIIKAPVLWKQYVFEDFAKVTGATIVEDASGVTFKNLGPQHLGTCTKITVDKETTTVISNQDISEHLKALKEEGSEDSKLRLSWLANKTALLYLGANNESELSHKRLKCNDAIHSSVSALKEGIVKGAGLALFDASNVLPDTIAGNILKEAIKAPHAQILANQRGQELDSTVMDSVVVIKNAVRNAVAMASTILTLGGDIAIPEKTPEQIAAEALQAKGMRF